jgi:hypothetical protein
LVHAGFKEEHDREQRERVASIAAAAPPTSNMFLYMQPTVMSQLRPLQEDRRFDSNDSRYNGSINNNRATSSTLAPTNHMDENWGAFRAFRSNNRNLIRSSVAASTRFASAAVDESAGDEDGSMSSSNNNSTRNLYGSNDRMLRAREQPYTQRLQIQREHGDRLQHDDDDDNEGLGWRRRQISNVLNESSTRAMMIHADSGIDSHVGNYDHNYNNAHPWTRSGSPPRSSSTRNMGSLNLREQMSNEHRTVSRQTPAAEVLEAESVATLARMLLV